MRLLLDERYPVALTRALEEVGIEAVTVASLHLTGMPDPEVFSAAHTSGRAVLTENVADFTRLAADRLNSGGHHAGLLIALSSRFSHRPSGVRTLAMAVHDAGTEDLTDRVIYLRNPLGEPDHLPQNLLSRAIASRLKQSTHESARWMVPTPTPKDISIR